MAEALKPKDRKEKGKWEQRTKVGERLCRAL